jgi:hypothetical protein
MLVVDRKDGGNTSLIVRIQIDRAINDLFWRKRVRKGEKEKEKEITI